MHNLIRNTFHCTKQVRFIKVSNQQIIFTYFHFSAVFSFTFLSFSFCLCVRSLLCWSKIKSTLKSWDRVKEILTCSSIRISEMQLVKKVFKNCIWLIRFQCEWWRKEWKKATKQIEETDSDKHCFGQFKKKIKLHDVHAIQLEGW